MQLYNGEEGLYLTSEQVHSFLYHKQIGGDNSITGFLTNNLDFIVIKTNTRAHNFNPKNHLVVTVCKLTISVISVEEKVKIRPEHYPAMSIEPFLNYKNLMLNRSTSA